MKGIRIRPEKSGIKASLFDLEAEVMEIIWGAQWTEFSVADVHREILCVREIAYTTVMTTVARLEEKGLLCRRKSGRRYIYWPKMTRKEFIQTMTQEVLSALPPVGHETAMALLVDQIDQANADDLDRLEALIQSRRKQVEGGTASSVPSADDEVVR